MRVAWLGRLARSACLGGRAEALPCAPARCGHVALGGAAAGAGAAGSKPGRLILARHGNCGGSCCLSVTGDGGAATAASAWAPRGGGPAGVRRRGVQRRRSHTRRLRRGDAATGLGHGDAAGVMEGQAVNVESAGAGDAAGLNAHAGGTLLRLASSLRALGAAGRRAGRRRNAALASSGAAAAGGEPTCDAGDVGAVATAVQAPLAGVKCAAAATAAGLVTAVVLIVVALAAAAAVVVIFIIFVIFVVVVVACAAADAVGRAERPAMASPGHHAPRVERVCRHMQRRHVDVHELTRGGHTRLGAVSLQAQADAVARRSADAARR